MFHPLHIEQELVGKDGDIGLFDSCCIKDVDDGVGAQGFIYDLLDGGFNFNI